MNSPKTRKQLFLAVLMMAFIISTACFADVESSMLGIKTKLTSTILPILSVIALIAAAFSFLVGNPNAKTHIIYAVVGCIIGNAAESLVRLIQSVVR